MNKLFFLVLCLLIGIGVMAQNTVKMHLSDGNDLYYDVDDVEYLTFEQTYSDEKGGLYSEWEYVEIPQYSTGTSWTYVNSGNIDLSAYSNKDIQIAFHYEGRLEESCTWEIKNLCVRNESTVIYVDDLRSSNCGFSFEYAETPNAAPVWNVSPVYGLIATSYSKATNTRSEVSVKAMSPIYSLEEDCYLYFDHAYRYTSTPQEDCRLAIRTVLKKPISDEGGEDPDDSLVQPGCVDLGLSVIWSSFNLGAERMADSGNYYSWGEVEPQKDGRYDWNSYLNCYGATDLEWSSDGAEGDVMKEYVFGGDKYDAEKGIAGSGYDAATVKLQNGWRLPTKAEFEELMDPEKCQWTWCYMNYGQDFIAGYYITSLIEGYTEKSIFLPAAGYIKHNHIRLYDGRGNYWTSTPSENSVQAYSLDIRENLELTFYNCMRATGFSIRPVKDKTE